MSEQSIDRAGELADSVSNFSDELGDAVSPADLFRVGLTWTQVRQIRHLVEAGAEQDEPHLSTLGFAIDSTERWGVSRVRRMEEKGRDWHIEPLRYLQPRSFAILSEGGTQLRAGYQTIFGPGMGLEMRFSVLPVSTLVVRDRLLAIEPHVQGWSPEEGHPGVEGVPSDYPEFLLNSWWFRVASWRLLRRLPDSVYTWAQPLLQQPTCGTSLKDILRWMSPTHARKYRPALIERFGADSYNKTYLTGRTALLCIIDTRPPETVHTPVGDQLFLNRGGSDKRIYHVRNGRFDQLRALVPASAPECMDRYFEHVLARVPGEFDFMPFTELA